MTHARGVAHLGAAPTATAGEAVVRADGSRFPRLAAAVAGLVPRWVRSHVVARHHATTLARSRRAVRDRVRRGEHIGRNPYGYRRVRVRTGDGPRPAADRGDRSRWVLVPDPRSVLAVEQIFHWRGIDRFGPTRIAGLLNADSDRYPPPQRPDRAAADPPRSSGSREGVGVGWTAARVRQVLTNPVYMGIAVHGRTHRGRPVPPEDWIVSGQGAHPALVRPWLFRAAQMPIGSRRSIPALNAESRVGR